MEMYMAIYKCRLCGKEFCNSGTGDKDTAATATMYTVLESSGITRSLNSKRCQHSLVFTAARMEATGWVIS